MQPTTPPPVADKGATATTPKKTSPTPSKILNAPPPPPKGGQSPNLRKISEEQKEDEDEISLELALHSSSSGSSSSSGEDSLFAEDGDEEEESNYIKRRSMAPGAGNNLIKVATNRDAYGTWNRPMDFTTTLIGYVLGIHNFFRFPHMCYKWGTATFLLPYAIFVAFVGFPTIFMECAVGQFYGVGSSTAFRQLAPIISGVSYILAWNSFLNCWIFGLILTWTRSYSGDSLSCLKGWMGCEASHYFNTPHCYTAILDDCCSGLTAVSDSQFCPELITKYRENTVKPNVTAGGGIDPYARLYYDFRCIGMTDFCSLHGWDFVGGKMCQDVKTGKKYSIYERRTHATSEYLYGFVLGMRKVFVEQSQKLVREACQKAKGKKICNKEEYWDTNLNPHRKSVFMDPNRVKGFWTGNATFMQLDPQSSSFIQLPAQAMTTVLFITFFLSVDILSVSIVTHVMGTVPFLILLALTVDAMGKPGSTEGIDDMLSLRGIDNLWKSGDLWADALIQVIITSGVGNGALVSLASFNKYHHPFLFDVLIVTLLNVATSLLATLICFCAIGSYVHTYGISTGFAGFLRPESTYSSVDFGFLVYSYFLTIIDRNDFEILVMFFMLSSFPTDTTIRLAQNMLDTAVQILPRIRYHSVMALLATSFFFLVALLPITRNGGILLFLEFEYCAHRFAMPIVALLEIIAIAWVYKAERLMDDAELLGVSLPLFRTYVRFSLKIFAPLVITALIVFNGAIAKMEPRMKTVYTSSNAGLEKAVGWIFSLTPPILLLLSVLKQLTSVPRADWKDLFVPMISWDKVRGAAKKQRKEKLKLKEKLAALKDELDPSIAKSKSQGISGLSATSLQPKGLRPTIDTHSEHAVGAEHLLQQTHQEEKEKEKKQPKKKKKEEEDAEAVGGAKEEGGVEGDDKVKKMRKKKVKGKAEEETGGVEDDGGGPTIPHNSMMVGKDDELRRLILDVKTRRVGATGSVAVGHPERGAVGPPVDVGGGINEGAMPGSLNTAVEGGGGGEIMKSLEEEGMQIEGVELLEEGIEGGAVGVVGDRVSLDSQEVANWKKFIMWNEIIAHLEDWPDRLDDSEVESEGSSVNSSEEDEEEQKEDRKRLQQGGGHHHSRSGHHHSHSHHHSHAAKGGG